MMRLSRGAVAVSILLLAGPFLDVLASAAEPRSPRDPIREVTLPPGTILRVRVDRGFGSDISRIEDPVHGTLARPVIVRGAEVLPVGSALGGYVSSAVRSGRVKGRARVAVRFTRLNPAGGESYSIRTRPWVAVAPATKKKDALTIGLPAAGGAVLGGILGGKKGAAVGAAAGGGGGTAVVLTTRGKEVRVGRGSTLAVRLSAPLTVRLD